MEVDIKYRCSLIIFVVFSQTISKVSSLLPGDPDCGLTKGCFPDCRSAGCDYLVTWRNAGTNAVQFTMLLARDTLPPYVAIGFSSDYRMGDDSVVGCVFATNMCYSSYNDGTDNHALVQPTAGIIASNIAHVNGIINCTFTRQHTPETPDSQYFDTKHNKYILMFVHGKTELKKGFLAIDSHHMIPFASDVMVDFTSHNIVPEHKWNTPVIKLHGMVMTTAWLLFSCVGIITARYNKLLLKRYRLFNTQVWFQVHRAMMVAVICLTITGFVAVFVDVRGYSQLHPPSSLAATSVHPVLGIIVTSLAILNVIGGLSRPGVDHKYRLLFNWVHFSSGILTQLLAFTNILIGYQMQRAYLSGSVFYVGLAQVIFTVVVFAALQIHQWSVKKAQDSTFVGLADPFVLNSSKTVSEMYTYILLAYGTMMLLFTMVVVGLIAAS